MTTHLSETWIKDKIPTELPVSRNVKSTQKFDEYTKELLVENKKTLTLSSQNVVKNIQENVVVVLSLASDDNMMKVMKMVKD